MMKHHKFRNTPWPLKVLFFTLMAAIFLFAITGIVFLLWNAILPKVTPVKEITYWQAMGILLLSKILFGSMKFGKHHKQHGPSESFRGKWKSMSEEQRAEFKKRWKERCGD